MILLRKTLQAALLLAAAAPAASGQTGATPENFDALRRLIRPHEGESRWREVDWLTSLHEARVRAAAEGKPILLWSGGGAPPLGGC